MSENKETQTRIYESDKEVLVALAAKYNMKSSVILGHLIDVAKKYNILDEGWMDELAKDKFQEMLEDADIDFRKKVELKKIDAQIKAKIMVFKEWMNTLDPTQKKQFLENVLGDTKSGDLLDKLTNYQMFMINGDKRLYPVDEQGYPIIAFTKAEDVVSCLKGFHIMNTRCNCRYWEGCQYGKQAYEDWLAANGTKLEQNRYLEEQNRQYRLKYTS